MPTLENFPHPGDKANYLYFKTTFEKFLTLNECLLIVCVYKKKITFILFIFCIFEHFNQGNIENVME